MKTKTINIYKFRQLINCTDFKRIKKIIISNKFWCSKFYDLNDPMEGVYTCTKNLNLINKIFSKKNSTHICSFCGTKGLNNLAMWGYYAGGGKGIAIELSTSPQDNIKKMNYVKNIKEQNFVHDILLEKLDFWKHEDEYRFLGDNKEHEIGVISKVFFGTPYFGVKNSDSIISSSLILQNYISFKEKLIKILDTNNIKYEDFDLIKNKSSVTKTHVGGFTK
jgi:hypothetical protein